MSFIPNAVKAFHLKYEEMKLDTNVSKWAVHVIELSRTKRHLDRARLMTIWEQLDKYVLPLLFDYIYATNSYDSQCNRFIDKSIFPF